MRHGDTGFSLQVVEMRNRLTFREALCFFSGDRLKG